jgi:hypothetical protein
LSTDKLLVAALRYAQSILAEHIAAGLCRKLHSTDSLDEAAAQLGRTALIILGMQIESMDMDTAPEEKQKGGAATAPPGERPIEEG